MPSAELPDVTTERHMCQGARFHFDNLVRGVAASAYAHSPEETPHA